MSSSPVYASWDDYLGRTTDAERMRRCHAQSKRANRVHRCKWRMKTTAHDFFWSVRMRERFKDPCGHCGSLDGQECVGQVKLIGRDIWGVLERAKGRCTYCNSLAVENRPSHPQKGSPLTWEHMGRRIGSLEHCEAYLDGRMNHPSNLRWACLWCNVHRHARIPGATDHGGFHPV